MQASSRQICDHAIAPEDYILNRFVIGQHGNDRVATTSLGNAGCQRGALLDQRLCICRRA
jgi:hypothetical protein